MFLRLPYRKNTLFWAVNAPFLEPFRLPCTGHHQHTPRVGSLTTAAAEYPKEFCSLWSELVAASLEGKAWPPAQPGPSPGAVESPARCFISRGLPWRERERILWRRPEHINILEVRMIGRVWSALLSAGPM